MSVLYLNAVHVLYVRVSHDVHSHRHCNVSNTIPGNNTCLIVVPLSEHVLIFAYWHVHHKMSTNVNFSNATR